MIFQHTQVPNILFDTHLRELTESELKILLVIIRQTNGWVDTNTGKRKTRDRISHSQFMSKTGLSRRAISKALNNLVDKDLIRITCHTGNLLQHADDRQGKTSLFYSFNMCTKEPQPGQLTTQTCAQSAHNKRNYSKENITKKSRMPIRQNTTGSINEIIQQSKYQSLLRF